MFWCDYCKVWMNDNPATKATHENGLKHKDMVARSKTLNIHPVIYVSLQTYYALKQRISRYQSVLIVP